MARRLFLDVLTVLCLVLLVPVLVLWGRSYWFADDVFSSTIQDFDHSGLWELATYPGSFRLVRLETVVVARATDPDWDGIGTRLAGGTGLRQRTSNVETDLVMRPPPLRGGFGAWRVQYENNFLANGERVFDRTTGWGIAAPYPIPAALLVALPLLRIALAWGQSRRAGQPGTQARRRAGVRPLLLRLGLTACVLAALAAAGMWVLSYGSRDMVGRRALARGRSSSAGGRFESLFAGSFRGVAWLTWDSWTDGLSAPWGSPAVSYELDTERAELVVPFSPSRGVLIDRIGFVLAVDATAYPARPATAMASAKPPSLQQVLYVQVPWWALIAVLLAPVAVHLWRLRRVRRAPDGQSPRCAMCGYDLRATPDRCPECGTVVGRQEPPRITLVRR